MKTAALALCTAAAICTEGQPRPAPGDFSLEYTLHAGYGFKPLIIIVEGGAAEMTRNEGRSEGAAIGVFRGEVTAEQRERLGRAAPDGLRSAARLAPDSPYYSVRLRTRGRNVDLRIPQGAVAEVAALMRELSSLETQTAWKPVRAVQVELTPPSAPAAAGRVQEYTVRLHNPGVEAARVACDAGGIAIEALPAVPPAPKAGFTPPPRIWERVSGNAVVPPVLEIAAGGSAEIRLPVTFDRPGDLLVHARLTTARAAAGGAGEVRGSAVSKPSHVSVK